MSRYIDGTWDGPAKRLLLREIITEEIKYHKAFQECYYIYKEGKFYSSVDKDDLVDKVIAGIYSGQPTLKTNEKERTMPSITDKDKIRAAKKAQIDALTGDVLAVSPDKAAVKEDRNESVAYDTAVEDFIDLLVAVTDGFQLFPPEATEETKERIFDDAVSCIQSGRE